MYLSQSVNYTLLAELHHFKIIVLPNYKLILVKCNGEITTEEFRKRIKSIVLKIKNEEYIESLATRKNGEMIEYYIVFQKL